MTKPILLSLAFCLLTIFHGSQAVRLFQMRNQCQLNRINALEPDHRIESEGGVIESWNPNHDQFQCAGVAISKHYIEPNGLLLPEYSNSPRLVYIVQGKGMVGVVLPGCAETFQESQQSASSGKSLQQEQHQKIRHIRRGDIIALPAGVAYWSYNDGNEPIVSVVLDDTANTDNQLDNNPRRFYLAGNPEDEFRQQFMRPSERERGEYSYPLPSERREKSCNNIFCGFDSRLLAEAFNVDEQLARKLQSRNDFRGRIVKVEDHLKVTRPSRTQIEQEEQEESEYDDRRRRGGECNGIEETYCTMKLRENIADPSGTDVYVPEVGRMRTVNSHSLPILRSLQLSASHVVLRNNAVRMPHWNMNAHSILYAIRGQARIQVVDENGNNVFDGNVRRGQVLTLPQNFMVVKKAASEGFEYVAFKTNDKAMTSDVVGQTSAIRGMPEEVLANAFQLSIHEVRRIKFNRPETAFGSTRSQSPRKGADWAIA